MRIDNKPLRDIVATAPLLIGQMLVHIRGVLVPLVSTQKGQRKYTYIKPSGPDKLGEWVKHCAVYFTNMTLTHFWKKLRTIFFTFLRISNQIYSFFVKNIQIEFRRYDPGTWFKSISKVWSWVRPSNSWETVHRQIFSFVNKASAYKGGLMLKNDPALNMLC